MLSKLESFYDNAILPELVVPQYPHRHSVSQDLGDSLVTI